MGGTRSVASKWCLLRDDTTLRTAIVYKIKSQKLRLADLERETGIQAYRISRYINGRKPHLSQFQLVSLAKFLGIQVTLETTFF
jgi:hypothetical protein